MFRIDERGRMLMGDADKLKTDLILEDGQTRVCPSHRIPHVFPWQSPVTDEPCHIHINPIKHYGHHAIFCKMIKCPNYESMCRAKERYPSK